MLHRRSAAAPVRPCAARAPRRVAFLLSPPLIDGVRAKAPACGRNRLGAELLSLGPWLGPTLSRYRTTAAGWDANVRIAARRDESRTLSRLRVFFGCCRSFVCV